MTIEAFQGLLGGVAIKVGPSELKGDEDSYCALSFDDFPVHFQIERVHVNLHLTTPIATA